MFRFVRSNAVKFVQILDWFLHEENSQHWAAVQKLATKDTPAAFETLKKYVLEACRFSSGLALVRICIPKQGETASVRNDQGENIMTKKGEVVLCNVVSHIFYPGDYPQLHKHADSHCLSQDGRVP